MGVVLPVQKKPGHVARVDRLDQHVAPTAGGQLGSPTQIGHVKRLQLFTRLTIGHQAGHEVNARAVECVGIVQRHLHAGAELGFTPGHRRRAAHTGFVPGVRNAVGIGAACRCIEQHLLEAIALEAGRQLLWGPGVGKQILDGLETIFGRRFKALQKRQLGVHQRKIGGKLGHDVG